MPLPGHQSREPARVRIPFATVSKLGLFLSLQWIHFLYKSLIMLSPWAYIIKKVGRWSLLGKVIQCERFVCKEKAATFADNTPSFTLSDGSVNDGYLLPDGVHLTRTAVDRVVKNLRLPVKGPTRGVTASQQKPRQSQTARAERRPPRAQEVEDEGWQKVRRRSHRTSTPPRGNTQCYFCGESGHVKDSCRHGHRVECNTCGGLGHKAKFCTR